MARTLSANSVQKKDPTGAWLGWFAAIMAAVGLAASCFADPAQTTERLAQRCLIGASDGPTVTLECTGIVFDLAVKRFLEQPRHRDLEIAGIARTAGHGFVVALRERR